MSHIAERIPAGTQPQADAERSLQEVSYLNPGDPIDAYLIDYRAAINKDKVPTMAQQRVMTAGLRNGQSNALQEFITSHMGIVAAVAYPYKDGGLTSEELLQAGIQALVRAGRDYVRADAIDFSDFAASAVNDELGSLLPDKARESHIGSSGYPMQDIYQFMQTVEVLEIPVEETLPAEPAPAAEAEVTVATAGESEVLASPASDAQGPDGSGADEAGAEPEIPAGPSDEAVVSDEVEAAPEDAAETTEPQEDAPKPKLTLEEEFEEKCGFVEGADMGDYDRETVLAYMRPKEREANEIYFFSGRHMTWQEVGEILGISQMAAYSRGRAGWSTAHYGIRRARNPQAYDI